MKRIYSKHGLTGTKLHEVWKEMHRRCRGTSPHSIAYKEKGIAVCEDWTSAKLFIEWALANGYREGLQLDRENNSGDYSPENCRWVTPKENANNKANTVYLAFGGKRQSLRAWADELGVQQHSLYTRYRRGWAEDKIISKPFQKRTA